MRYSFEIKFETSRKYRAKFFASFWTPIEKYPPFNKNIEIKVLHHWYYLSPITFVTIRIQQYFKYQNFWPLTLLKCALCKPVFPRTTNNLICQFIFNIHKSSHWKWNVFMLRKNHSGSLPRIWLMRSWIPFLLAIESLGQYISSS